MTDVQQALAHVREAISAEVRPGEWRISKYREGRDALIYDANGFEVARVCYPNRDANASLIAACSPANIAAILAHVEAQKAEIERLRGLLCKCDMRTRLVGNGCEFCNPQLAEELAKEQR